jgi:hypothetical protein
MVSRIFCSVSCPHCDRSIEALFVGQTISCPHCGGRIKRPIFPALDKATNKIHAIRIIPHSEYMRLPPDERRDLFTVPGIENIDTLDKVRRILGDCFEKGIDLGAFERKLRREFGRSLALSSHCIEKVFRGYVNRALTDGLIETVEHPLITSGFPYLSFDAIRDNRTPATHLALEHFGINGTNVYRRDDPFWRRFLPPLTDLCRCSVVVTSIDQAAERGVKEAQEWLRTGEPPARPEWVKSPHVDPRLELEDEGPECLESPHEILQEVLALRDHLIREMERTSSGSRTGRLPRKALRAPRTPEEGLALLEGRIEPEFTLPPLHDYFEVMEWLGIENVPSWKGEPENDLEYLETIDSMIACCSQTAGRKRPK